MRWITSRENEYTLEGEVVNVEVYRFESCGGKILWGVRYRRKYLAGSGKMSVQCDSFSVPFDRQYMIDNGWAESESNAKKAGEAWLKKNDNASMLAYSAF